MCFKACFGWEALFSCPECSGSGRVYSLLASCAFGRTLVADVCLWLGEGRVWGRLRNKKKAAMRIGRAKEEWRQERSLPFKMLERRQRFSPAAVDYEDAGASYRATDRSFRCVPKAVIASIPDLRFPTVPRPCLPHDSPIRSRGFSVIPRGPFFLYF